MSRKQYIPSGSSHEKKITRKERKQQAIENPVVGNQPQQFSAPTETDKKQLRNLTIVAVVGLFVLLGLMYYIFINNA
jgi:hypothetical protein